MLEKDTEEESQKATMVQEYRPDWKANAKKLQEIQSRDQQKDESHTYSHERETEHVDQTFHRKCAYVCEREEYALEKKPEEKEDPRLHRQVEAKEEKEDRLRRQVEPSTNPQILNAQIPVVEWCLWFALSSG